MNLLQQGYFWTGGGDADPRVLDTDVVLIREVEEIVDGADIHKAASLIGTYRTSVDYHKLTGEFALWETALETERELRKLLTKGQMMRALELFG